MTLTKDLNPLQIFINRKSHPRYRILQIDTKFFFKTRSLSKEALSKAYKSSLSTFKVYK